MYWNVFKATSDPKKGYCTITDIDRILSRLLRYAKNASKEIYNLDITKS